MIRFLNAVRTAVLVAAVLVGMPAILVAIGGRPVPVRLPALEQFQAWVDEPFAPRYAASTARVLVWLLWLLVAAGLCGAAGARLRRPRWIRLVGSLPGPVQGLAAALVGAATVTTATSGLAAAAPPAGVAVPHGLAPAVAGEESVTGTADTPTAGTTMAARPAGSPVSGTSTGARAVTPIVSAKHAPQPGLPVYTVATGDRMVDVAGRFLGDRSRYVEIAGLNPRWERHDARFPDHWEPGWRVVLPADAQWHAPYRHAAGRLVLPASPPAAVPDPAHGGHTPSQPSAATPTGTDPAGAAPTARNPVVPEPRTPRPSSATSGQSSGGMRSPASAPQSTDPRTGTDSDIADGAEVPGGWVGLPLAAALVAAAALVWRQRRYRYRPQPLDDQPLDEPDLGPLPAVVTRMRHAVVSQNPGLLDPQPGHRHPTVAEYGRRELEEPDLEPAGPDGADLAGFAGLIPAGGLGLTGPGAESAARALLVAALSAGGAADPDARGQVIIPADALSALLGADCTEFACPARLIVTASLSEALLWAEEQLLERRRQLHEYDAADLPALRAATPYHPPMPPVLLLARVPAADLAARLSTTMRLGAALQISAVLLGDWSSGDTTTVHADGHLATADHQRLATLDAPTARQMLQVLREAHTGQQPRPSVQPGSCPSNEAVAGPAPAAPNAHPSSVTPANTPGPEPTPLTESSTPTASTSPDEVAESGTVSTADPSQRKASNTGTTSPPRAHCVQVRIRLLGAPAIIDRDGIAVTGLRFHARQLLVYLAVHRSGADLPQIMEAFWPTATLRRAGERLSTEAGDLRSRIRQAAGDRTIQPVINTGGRYVLNADVLDIDLWNVSDALRRAGAATDPATRITALRAAVDAHTGNLADGHDYDWIDQHREQVRRYGVRARLHLADLIAGTDPRPAAALAESAADLDRYSEDAARQAIRALARIGDTVGIRARLQTLRDALDTIDEEPSGETIALAAQLQREISARAGHPGTDIDHDGHAETTDDRASVADPIDEPVSR